MSDSELDSGLWKLCVIWESIHFVPVVCTAREDHAGTGEDVADQTHSSEGAFGFSAHPTPKGLLRMGSYLYAELPGKKKKVSQSSGIFLAVPHQKCSLVMVLHDTVRKSKAHKISFSLNTKNGNNHKLLQTVITWTQNEIVSMTLFIKQLLITDPRCRRENHHHIQKYFCTSPRFGPRLSHLTVQAQHHQHREEEDGPERGQG